MKKAVRLLVSAVLLTASLVPVLQIVGGTQKVHAESVALTIPVNSGNSRGVAISPDGLFAYVTSELDDTLTKVDLTTDTVVSVFNVGREPYNVAISPNGQIAMVTNSSGNSVSRINLSTNAITTIPLGQFAMDVAIDSASSFAYVTEFYNNRVAKIDLSTNAIVGRVTVGGGPRGIAITPSGDFAYTANDSSGTASKIDLSTFTRVATITTGTNPYGVTVDQDGIYVYVLNLNSSTVSKVSIATDTVVGSISIANPWEMAIVPGTTFAYVTTMNSSTIVKVNLRSFTRIGSVALDANPRVLAVTPNSTRVYVTNYSNGQLQRVDIVPEFQSITFSSIPSSERWTSTVELSASLSSELSVSFASSTSDICTVLGTVVSLLAYGTCTVTANQASTTAGWAAPSAVSRSFEVVRQTISFTQPADVLLSAGTVSLSATASSGQSVVFSSSTSDVCTVSGVTVTLNGYGTCTVAGNQTTNSDVANTVSRSFEVVRQTISFTQPADVLLSAGTVSLSATASSGQSVVFSSSTSDVCTVSGVTVTLNGYGTCTVAGNQTTNSDVANTVSRSFEVVRQTISFTQPADVLLSAGTVSLSATASSGQSVVFSSSTSDVCTVSGVTVTLNGYGTCTVAGNQTTNSDVANTVSRSFEVVRQTISFTQPADVLLSAGTVSLSATASSGQSVVFSSSTSDVCTVSGVTVTLKAPGDCVVDANQSTNGDTAESVSRTFVVKPIPPIGEQGVSINEGRTYTNSKNVTLRVVWPSGAAAVRISNDGGFSPSTTKLMSLKEFISWDLDDSVKGAYTKVVYLRFSGSGVDESRTQSDDIILDTTAPVVEDSSASAVAGSIDISLKATDDKAGVEKVQIKNGSTTVTKDYESKILVTEKELGLSVTTASVRKTDSSTLEIRVSDKAGNWTAYQKLSVYRASSDVVTTPTLNTEVVTTPTVKRPVVSPKKSATAKSIATYAKLAVLSTSKVSLKVVSSYAKYCKVSRDNA
jgi:YVTN family beta-propeller protein